MPPSHDEAEELPSYTLFLLCLCLFSYVLPHVLAFSCELLFFYIPPAPFYYFFSLFIYASVLFLLLYISHALSYFFIYAIVSVIFCLRKRLLMLRLMFHRVQLHFCFLHFLPFLFFYQSSVTAFSSFFLLSFLIKGFISSLFSFFLFSRRGDLRFVCFFSPFSSVSALFSDFLFSFY